jgi:hypothetical protein
MKKIIRNVQQNVSATRMTFLSVAFVVALGNTLTGWGTVSFVLWIPPIALTLAAVTGVCPFLIVWQKLGFK